MKTLILTLLVTQMLNGVHVTHERYSDLAALLTWMKRALCGDLDRGEAQHRLASGRGVAPRVRWRALVTTSKTSVVNLTRAWRAVLSDLTTASVLGTRVDIIDGLSAQNLARHIATSRYDVVGGEMMERKIGWSLSDAFRPNGLRG